MEQVIRLQRVAMERDDRQYFAIDTTFVLFFLAVDIGMSVLAADFGTLLAVATLAMFVVFPYLLPFNGERPAFGGWVTGRLAIAGVALVAGILFSQGVGTIFPEVFKFLPLTLLMVAAIVSCSVQFYGIMRFRLAR